MDEILYRIKLRLKKKCFDPTSQQLRIQNHNVDSLTRIVDSYTDRSQLNGYSITSPGIYILYMENVGLARRA